MMRLLLYQRTRTSLILIKLINEIDILSEKVSITLFFKTRVVMSHVFCVFFKLLWIRMFYMFKHMYPKLNYKKCTKGMRHYYPCFEEKCYRNTAVSRLKCKFHRKASMQHACKDFQVHLSSTKRVNKGRLSSFKLKSWLRDKRVHS